MFWLEWGSYIAGRSLPAARSRFRAVHSDSISTRRSQPVWRHDTRSLHFADRRSRDDLLRLDDRVQKSERPTQAKGGLEWAPVRAALDFMAKL